MKILITGGKGQLGTELVKCLERGFTEIGELDAPVKSAEFMAVDIDVLDITNIDMVREYVKKYDFDAIINCAAYTNVDKCETDYDNAFKANAIGPRNLAIVAKEINAKLLHISTDYVFAGNATKAYNECSICNPQSAYGSTKYLGEQYIRDFSDKYFIVRTSWLYGYYGGNFVKTMQRLGSTKTEISVVNDQRGNPTNCADLAYHIFKLINSEEYGMYHCTGEGECSWYEFACEIMKMSGLNCKVKPCTSAEFPSPTKRPAFSSLDNMSLRCTVGNNMRDWKLSLECFIKNQEDRI